MTKTGVPWPTEPQRSVWTWRFVVFTILMGLLWVLGVIWASGQKPAETPQSRPAFVPARERHKAEREAKRMREGIERIEAAMERERVRRLLEER